MSPSIYVEVEAYAGSNISDVVRDCIRVAHRIGADVSFKFNGIGLIVHATDDADEIVRRYLATTGCERTN